MYYANKIVGWCLSPLGMCFLGVLLGVCLIRARACGTCLRRCGKTLVVLALLQLWVLSCGVTTRFIGLSLEGEEIDIRDLPTADAIVLLGGGMGYHAQCGRPEIYAAGDRAWTAARLFTAGKAPLLTVSGGGAKGELALLADLGVDTNRVFVIEDARNTEEEARYISSAISSSANGVRRSASAPRILLVTSAWHMPRARTLFARVGFDVVAAPTDYEMHAAAEAPSRPMDFFPSVEALTRNSYAVKEWIARALYALKR